jgi:hypothetical protein
MYIKKVRPMNMKWKVALLTLLGFSTAACCNTKKLGKSEDAKSDPVETETEDPRIMLMYGVPFPDGEVARPIEEAKEFPDGGVAKPVSEEDAQKTLDAIKAEKEARAKAEAEK